MNNATETSQEEQRKVAVLVAERVTDSERTALLSWLSQLLEIRDSDLAATKKASAALKVTAQRKVVWPTAKLIWREVKRRAWDERSLKGRLGLSGMAIGATVFAGQGAGIAALGTAVGVPLWIVFGAGGAFAGMLIEELMGKKRSKTSYTVIDAKKDDDDAA